MVQFALIIGNRFISKVIEVCKPVYVLPYLINIRVKDMWTILVNLNPLYFLRVDISSNMSSFIDYKNTFSFFLCLLRKYCPE